MALTTNQKKTILASYLGWTLDGFDFFLLTFLMGDIAAEFGTDIYTVSWALFFTLSTRFVGAFIFGRIGDKWGRKPALMLDIVSYSVIGALAAFAPNLWIFLGLRLIFGIAMGGEWGLGSSLAMESIPTESRGFVSGLLQAGYPSGFLLASLAEWLLHGHNFGGFVFGWRAMFLLSIIPALLVLFIRSHVDESPAFMAAARATKPTLWQAINNNWSLVIYAVIMMMLFNFFSHGTQDVFPTFLKIQHGFDPATAGKINVIGNIGAIVGGIVFGSLSQRIGRINAITIASLLALPAIYFWAFSETAVVLAFGAFIMQVAVQGAWGVVPAHLNEISPGAVRATLPAFIYQAGNLLAAVNGPLQTYIAKSNGGNYGLALALVAGIVAIALAIVIRFSPEKRLDTLNAH